MKSASELMSEHAAHVTRDKTAETDEIIKTLVDRFGWGDRPDMRSKWYDRVRETMLQYGAKPTGIVKKLRSRSTTKNSPSKYFIASVTRQFEDNGWW